MVEDFSVGVIDSVVLGFFLFEFIFIVLGMIVNFLVLNIICILIIFKFMFLLRFFFWILVKYLIIY